MNLSVPHSIKVASAKASKMLALTLIQVIVPFVQTLSHLVSCAELLGIDNDANWITMVFLNRACASIPLELDLVHKANLNATRDLLLVDVQVFQPASVETNLGVEGRFVKLCPFASQFLIVSLRLTANLCPLFLFQTYGFIHFGVTT